MAIYIQSLIRKKLIEQSFRTMMFFGLLAAVFSYLRFTIPGVDGAVSDAREIVALFSVVFLSGWGYAAGVGLLAAFGGPYESSFLTGIVMHIVAIPAAWFFLHWLKRKINKSLIFSSIWFLFVILLYLLVYLPLFAVFEWVFGNIELTQIVNTYLVFLSAAKFEAVITAIITSFAISFIHMQDRLDEESSRLELALEGADLGLWNWDINSAIKTYNERWASMLGFSLKEISEKSDPWKEMVHSDDRGSVLKKLNAHLQGQTEIYQAEYRMRMKNGTWKWIYDRGRIVARDESGKPLRMSGTHLDITERKCSEEEKKKLQSQLMQSQKMEAVGVLAGGVAHDFNNLLTVISGHAELALMKTESLEKVQKDILAIQKAGKRAENLTSQLLAFSRKQMYNPAVININQVINHIDQMIRRLIGEDIHIEKVLSKDLPSIKADPVQVEQMLLNLLVNARDAVNAQTEIASEKKIIIETNYKFLDSSYAENHPGCPAGPYIIISVSDTGIGMKKETKEKIFEPFFSTKELGKGTGLGLAMVYGIVKQNKGYINVYSEPGYGTTFKINWPATYEEVTEIDESTITENSITGAETILLVEDDHAVRNFASNALQFLGYTVFEAVNGKDALELFEKKQTQIDLIITDLIMPEMNGKELVQKIKVISPSVHILFTSGYTENHIVHGGSLEKGIHFIVKPYSISGLAKKAREVLDKPSSPNEN